MNISGPRIDISEQEREHASLCLFKCAIRDINSCGIQP